MANKYDCIAAIFPNEGKRIEVHIFTAGSIVPQWVEKTTNLVMRFAVECDVDRFMDGSVAVYPHNKDELEKVGHMMRAGLIDKQEEGHIQGRPTVIYANPRGEAQAPSTFSA